ncbi:MAG TPA: hypothetical protein VM686_11355 [Polyangiaceae bacterium]|nr:hypothetical protein [Polyangiaceae bacterium]
MLLTEQLQPQLEPIRSDAAQQQQRRAAAERRRALLPALAPELQRRVPVKEWATEQAQLLELLLP